MRTHYDPAAILASFVQEVGAELHGEGFRLAERLGQAGQQRVERLEAARQRLAETLGEDHPRVAALQERGQLLRDVGDRIDLAAGRGRNRPKPRPQEWVAQGRVVDVHGRPLSGLTVRVADREGQFADVLGDTETDADGAFRLPYHRRVFGDEPPELFLVVEDAEGQALVSSDAGVHPAPDRTDFFQVVVPGERLGDDTPNGNGDGPDRRPPTGPTGPAGPDRPGPIAGPGGPDRPGPIAGPGGPDRPGPIAGPGDPDRPGPIAGPGGPDRP